MRDFAVGHRTDTTPFTPRPRQRRRTLEPLELARWVQAHADRLAEGWLAAVRARDRVWSDELDGLMEEFFRLLVSMLPATLGPFREQVEPLWVQTAELFGSVASQRGLAAGEVIEEFQLLRDGIIRLVFEDPPHDGDTRMSLRDVLRLNRVVDLGVTYASVGHTDALFFALFQGSGVPEPPDSDLRAEVRDQLQAIRDELGEIMKALRG